MCTCSLCIHCKIKTNQNFADFIKKIWWIFKIEANLGSISLAVLTLIGYKQSDKQATYIYSLYSVQAIKESKCSSREEFTEFSSGTNLENILSTSSSLIKGPRKKKLVSQFDIF